MGKAAMCIRMLQVLNTGRVYKCSELADILETNQRNVIEYKKELEEAGYYIVSVPGKNGGYRLDKTTTIPTLKFTENEKNAVAEGAGYLLSRNDFMYQRDYQSAMAKIFSSVSRALPEEEIAVYNHFPLTMSVDDLSERYEAVKSCIPLGKREYGRVMEITYLSLSNNVSTRDIHPYKLFMVNNAWFVLGFDEKRGAVLYFKLNRIQSYRVTDKKFKMLLSYNESDYLSEFGMKQYGEWHSIKLELHGVYAMLAHERLYGKNQTLESVDKDTTILSCEMQNKEDTVSFVLSFGSYCKVLEPEWLKEEVQKEAETIKNIYK